MSIPVLRTARRMAAPAALLISMLVLPTAALAQQPGAAARPQPRAEDVASIDAIIDALYDVISGPVGQARDWDRMRSLFIDGGRLIPTGVRPDGSGAHTLLAVEDYIQRSGETLVTMGFREVELGRVTEQFGNIAHAFSSYQAFRGSETEPFMRGINSIQLWNDGSRWWIVTVFWQQESPQHPLPARYIGTGR